MNMIWRTVLAALLIGGPAFWFSATETDAATQFAAPATDARGPLADNINNDDPDEVCGSSNPRKRKKCHYNGWDQNTNGNDNDADRAGLEHDGARRDRHGGRPDRRAEPDGRPAGAERAVRLEHQGERRRDRESIVVGRRAGPSGPFVDDLAFAGMQTYDCAGAQPCAWSWPVVARYLGPYMLHARVRDTNGREVQTDWKFDTVQAP